jgi:hypothetical protein
MLIQEQKYSIEKKCQQLIFSSNLNKSHGSSCISENAFPHELQAIVLIDRLFNVGLRPLNTPLYEYATNGGFTDSVSQTKARNRQSGD